MSDVTTTPTTPTPVSPAAPAAAGTAPVTAPTTSEAAAPPDPRIAAQFAVLTRKEQAAVKALNDAKALKAAADKATADAKAIEDKWGGYKGKPEKALEALKELGFTYDQITQLHLNGGNVTPEMVQQQLRDRIDGLEAQRIKDQEDARTAEATKAKADQEAAVSGFKDQITAHASDKTKYPAINHFAQISQIYDLIDGHYARTCTYDEQGRVTKPGQILAIPDASKMIEDYLVDQVKKSQELLTPPQATAPAPTTADPKPSPFKPVSKATTLTQSTTPVTSSTKPKRYQSDQELRDSIVAKYSRKPA